MTSKVELINVSEEFKASGTSDDEEAVAKVTETLPVHPWRSKDFLAANHNFPELSVFKDPQIVHVLLSYCFA